MTCEYCKGIKMSDTNFQKVKILIDIKNNSNKSYETLMVMTNFNSICICFFVHHFALNA